MVNYSAYQLIISSELTLPELTPVEGSVEALITKERPHISIVFGYARRESVPCPVVEGLYYHIQPEACWLEIPNIARFLVIQGRQIIVEPFPGIDEDSVRLFLYTVCFPLVLIYHNFFVLHGAAMNWGGRGVAFLAEFGLGKSTLLASFLQLNRNYGFISDDICVLNREGMMLPGFPYLQLREDAIKKFDIDPTTLKLMRPQVKKWCVPVQQAFYPQPVLLNTVYILNPTNRPDMQLTPLFGLKKVQFLKKYTYQPMFIKGLGKERFYFHQCAALAARINTTYVERAKHGLSWHACANVIEQDLQSRALACQ